MWRTLIHLVQNNDIDRERKFVNLFGKFSPLCELLILEVCLTVEVAKASESVKAKPVNP